MTPLKARPIPLLTDKQHARFETKIAYEPMSGCWLWLDAVGSKSGYGLFSIGRGKQYLAHRVSYQEAKGLIPEGLSIDHLCRTRSCVNPDHLEAVPIDVNIRRAGLNGVARINAARTNCGRCGEPLMLTSTGSQRHCYPCALVRQAEWERNKMATDPEYRERRRVAARERHRRNAAQKREERQNEPADAVR